MAIKRIKKADVAKRHAVNAQRDKQREANRREQKRKSLAIFMRTNKSNFIH